MSLVRMEKLSKTFEGGRKAVDEVSLSIEEGEAFGLLGPNGAGKTTMVLMLSCLLRPTTGDAWVDSASVIQDSLRVRRAIGVVPQEIALYPTLSARENLEFWSVMYDVPSRERKSRIEELLVVVGLADRQNERIDRYSGGMKRRVNIAVGLLGRPKLLILDEPTVGVDPQSRNSILETLKELNGQGLTLLYTSHYMEEVEFLCPRVAIMDQGRVIAHGTQEELRLLVGEQDAITIQLGSVPPDDILDKVHAIEGVSAAHHSEGDLTVLSNSGRRVLPAVLDKLFDAEVKVRSVAVREPNLESVFLHLTGKELRD